MSQNPATGPCIKCGAPSEGEFSEHPCRDFLCNRCGREAYFEDFFGVRAVLRRIARALLKLIGLVTWFLS